MTENNIWPGPTDCFYGSVLEDLFLALETDHFVELAKTHKSLNLDEFAFVTHKLWPHGAQDLAAE